MQIEKNEKKEKAHKNYHINKKINKITMDTHHYSPD